MKCPNCGANGVEGKFCQHCGSRLPEETAPTTIAGAIHGIAKSAIDEVGKQLEYNRVHAEELEERKTMRERENLKQGLYILIVAVVLIGGIIAFCMYMAAKEKGVL